MERIHSSSLFILVLFLKHFSHISLFPYPQYGYCDKDVKTETLRHTNSVNLHSLRWNLWTLRWTLRWNWTLAISLMTNWTPLLDLWMKTPCYQPKDLHMVDLPLLCLLWGDSWLLQDQGKPCQPSHSQPIAKIWPRWSWSKWCSKIWPRWSWSR